MEQGQLFDPDKVTAEQFKPNRRLQVHARRLARRAGSDYTPPDRQLQVDPQRGHAQNLDYQRAQAAPGERPGIRESYEAMRTHVGQQFDYLTSPKERGGMGFQVEFTDHDPYPTPQDMAADVKQGRIKAFKTESTGGHEFFSNEENDKFRAVHDVFGHAAVGRGFSRHGEEAAFQSHRQMFPKEAHAALASETRGQNSFVNWGPTGDFPEQGPGSKLIGLPDYASEPDTKLNLPAGSKNTSRAGRRAPMQGRLNL